MADPKNSYLDYLDKEMTIMGILSTFAVALVAVVLDRVASADPTKAIFYSLWRCEHWYILAGSASIFGAAGLFYRQRSLLAWYYGQITLSIEANDITGKTTHAWLKDADSWSAWLPYRLAFTALALGSGFYALAMLEFTSGSQVAQIWPITLTAATVLLSVAHALILQKYSTRDNPLREFWAPVRRKIHR